MTHKKITLLIGDRIERFVATHVPASAHVVNFPETGAEGRPQHLNRTIAAARLLFLDALSEGAKPLFVVTHCQGVVNHAGIMISDGLLRPEDVEVWKFDGEEPGTAPPSAKYGFSAEGCLTGNWPFGWFESDL